MALAGASADSLADWLLGKPVKFSDKVQDNVLKLAMMSTYQANQVVGERPDLEKTVQNYLLNTPALDIASALWKNSVKAVQDDQKGFLELMGQDQSALRAIPLGIGTITSARMFGQSKQRAADSMEDEVGYTTKRLTKEATALRNADGKAQSTETLNRKKKLGEFARLKKHYLDLSRAAALRGEYEEAQANLDRLEEIAKTPARWTVEAKAVKRLPEETP
jgi:hypothetical protein